MAKKAAGRGASEIEELSTSESRSPSTSGPSAPSALGQESRGSYTVVARRYRPQSFEEVLGQDHVVDALRHAIEQRRISHAYLFCGTRGVGKTSLARIFAKCLNCLQADGPTTKPCQVCASCQAISQGDGDLDVLEIDGASNNGVEAVRDLRQNAALRPSRSRYKIYYIDEVHMLSTGAFNALLKTLEEPPPHVKFVFATTEPGKIPVTVLSRCQRFDLAPMRTEVIADHLGRICRTESIETDPEALQALARRAGGSMRDAQSALEHLLASGTGRLSLERVQEVLGLPGDDLILDLLQAMAANDPGAVLLRTDHAIRQGIQPNDLLLSLIGRLRDLMVLAAGAPDNLIDAGPNLNEPLQTLSKSWSLDAVLAGLQVLDEARGRLRGSPHARVLVELALVRTARLAQLQDLSDLIGALTSAKDDQSPETASSESTKRHGSTSSRPSPSPQKKTAERTAEPLSTSVSDTKPVGRFSTSSSGMSKQANSASEPDLERVQDVWPLLLESLEGEARAWLQHTSPHAIFRPNTLVIIPKEGYSWVRSLCESNEVLSRVSRSLDRLLETGPWTITFEPTGSRVPPVVESEVSSAPTSSTDPSRSDEPGSVSTLENDPLIRELQDRFQARLVRAESDSGDRDSSTSD